MPLRNPLSLGWISPKSSTASSKTGTTLFLSSIAIDSKDELDYVSKIRKIRRHVKVAFDYQHETKTDERSRKRSCMSCPIDYRRTVQRWVYSPSELLFKGSKSLSEMIETSLERCTEDLRQEVMKNAFFYGGSSMLKGSTKS